MCKGTCVWVSDVISGIAPCRKIGERGNETKTKQTGVRRKDRYERCEMDLESLQRTWNCVGYKTCYIRITCTILDN